MNHENTSGGYIAVIDLGTSRIKGMVGRKSTGGEIQVVAVCEEESGSSIKRGCVYNLNEATALIERVIASMELKAGTKLNKLYVNINGQSLRSIDNDYERQLEKDEEVTSHDIDSINEEISEFIVPDYEVVYNTKPQFLVDGNRVGNPEGIIGTLLEARYKAIIARPSLKKNIAKCFGQSRELSYLVGPLVTATAVLSENEKQMGVALVDFGGGCTSLSVFKNGTLKHLAVIPFGGNNITKDIATLNIREDIAEKLKVRIGCTPLNPEEHTTVVEASNGAMISEAEISNMIEARQNEIWLNVWKQVEDEKLDKELAAGIVITGGASGMKGLVEHIKNKIQLGVKQAVSQEVNVIRGASGEQIKSPAYASLVGMLLSGKPDSVKVEVKEAPVSVPEVETVSGQQGTTGQPETGNIKQPEKQPEKKQKKVSFFKKLKENLQKDLFDDNSDDEVFN